MGYINKNNGLYEKLFVLPDFEFVEHSVTKYLVSIIEQITRAVVRQFTLGDLGDEPKKYIGSYSHFLFLNDSDIGVTNYFDKFFAKKNKKPYRLY